MVGLSPWRSARSCWRARRRGAGRRRSRVRTVMPRWSMLALGSGVRAGGATVERVAGEDRVATAVAASARTWGRGCGGRGGDRRRRVVPGRARRGAAGRRAGRAGAAHRRRRARRSAWRRSCNARCPPGAPVALLGGQAVLGAQVEQDLAGLGFAVTRYAGADRFATALDVCTNGLGEPAQLVLASGLGFADALGAGAVAAQLGGCVLLTADATLPDAVRAYLDAHPHAQRYCRRRSGGPGRPRRRGLRGPRPLRDQRRAAGALPPG